MLVVAPVAEPAAGAATCVCSSFNLSSAYSSNLEGFANAFHLPTVMDQVKSAFEIIFAVGHTTVGARIEKDVSVIGVVVLPLLT